MNKKGFVLLETIVVLVITVVCMLGLFLTYSFVFKNLKQAGHYDNINDVYKLNILYKMINNNSLSSISDYKIVTPNECSTYFTDSSCSDLMSNRINFDYVIITTANVDDILFSHGNDLKPSDINYIKTLENNFKYLIGVKLYSYDSFEDDYYVSLKVGEK